MPPTWKQTFAGTAYVESSVNRSRNGGTVSGIVYGLNDSTESSLSTAIATAISAVGRTLPGSTAVPLNRVSASWIKGGSGDNSPDNVGGTARVTLHYQFGSGSGITNATEYAALATMQSRLVPWATYELVPLSSINSDGTFSQVDAYSTINPNEDNLTQFVQPEQTITVPQYDIQIPLTSTVSAYSWSATLAGRINDAAHNIGGGSLPMGTLLLVGISSRVIRTSDDPTYIYDQVIQYAHRPWGFYRTKLIKDSAGATKAIGEWAYPQATFTLPPLDQ